MWFHHLLEPESMLCFWQSQCFQFVVASKQCLAEMQKSPGWDKLDKTVLLELVRFVTNSSGALCMV